MNRKLLRRVSVLCLAGTTALYPSVAFADPVSVGTVLINAALAVVPTGSALAYSIVATSAALVGNIAIAGASLAISLIAANANRPGQIDPGKAKEEIASEATSEIQAVGKVRVAGAVNYGNNNHPQLFRHILHTKGPLVQITNTYVNGREVFNDEDGNVLSSPWTEFKPFGVRNHYLKLRTKVGDGSETAFTELIEAFPDVWTINHRCRGIFQTLIEVTSPGTSDVSRYQKLFGARNYPLVEHVAKVSVIYDPRKDDTVTGGSGTHRQNDESTWEWTDNGALGAIHIMLQYPDVDHSKIDWERMIVAANKADEIVATLTGTEKRSRISGLWPSSNVRGTTMQQVLDSVGFHIRLTSLGKIYLEYEDDNPASELDLQYSDIYNIGGQEGPEAVERFNVCRIKYYSPEREYTMTEINLDGIPWASVPDEIDRWGEKVQEIYLPFCFSASQAQRIGRRMFTRGRAERGSVTTNMIGMACWGLETISIPISGDNEICKIGGPRCNDSDGTVEMPFVILEPLSEWNPATDEAPAPPTKASQVDDTNLDRPSAPTHAFMVTYPGGSKEFRVFYNSVPNADGYVAIYSPLDSEGFTGSWTPMDEVDDVYLNSKKDVDLTGQDIAVRVQVFDDGSSSEPSLPLNQTPVSENLDAPVQITNSDITITVTNSSLQVILEPVSKNIVDVRIIARRSNSTVVTLFNGDANFVRISETISAGSLTEFDQVEIRQTVSGGATRTDTFNV